MKALIGFLIGLFVGAVSVFSLIQNDNKYVELNTDYRMENGGLIKKGTLMRYDQGFSEGFTRYILYINIEEYSKKVSLKDDGANQVSPYWISPVNDSIPYAD